MNGNKEDDSHVINVTDSGSPKVENLVEVIDPAPLPQPQFATIKSHHRVIHNGMYVKRQKLENAGDDYEPIDMTSSSHLLPEVLAQDDCEVFGRSIAAQLRQMSRSQKIIAQRIMSEVCFRGQIQALNVATTLGPQTSPVFHQMPQPVLPPYAYKPVPVNSSRPSDYFTSHHPFSNVRQQQYVPQVTLGSAAVGGVASYQGCGSIQQPHSDHMGTVQLSSMSQSDVMP